MGDHQRTMRVAIVGRALTKWRATSGLLLHDLALKTGVSVATLSRLSAGKRCASLLDVGGLAAACDATGAERVEVVRLVEIGQQDSWTQFNHEQMSDELNVLHHVEHNARHVVVSHAQLIPELLQVPEYRQEEARRNVLHSTTSREINKQKFPATRWRFLVHEQAVRDLTPDPDILRKQVDHLLLMGQQPNVEIQIVPASIRTASGGHSFYLCEFDDQPDAVCLLHVNAATVFETTTVVDAYRRLAATLRTAAMDTDESHTFLTSMTNGR